MLLDGGLLDRWTGGQVVQTRRSIGKWPVGTAAGCQLAQLGKTCKNPPFQAESCANLLYSTLITIVAIKFRQFLSSRRHSSVHVWQRSLQLASANTTTHTISSMVLMQRTTTPEPSHTIVKPPGARTLE